MLDFLRQLAIGRVQIKCCQHNGIAWKHCEKKDIRPFYQRRNRQNFFLFWALTPGHDTFAMKSNSMREQMQ